MIAAPPVAKTAIHEGRSVIDSNSPIRFGLGFLAGTAGIEGAFVALAALSYEATRDVLEQESGEVVFERGRGESYANQAADLLLMMIGVYAGKFVRDWYEYRKSVAALSL